MLVTAANRKKSLTRKFPTPPRWCATEKQRSAVPH